MWEILNKKISRKKISSQKQLEKKLSFDQENVKLFIKKWNQGQTTSEIAESFKKVEIDISKTNKKIYKI